MKTIKFGSHFVRLGLLAGALGSLNHCDSDDGGGPTGKGGEGGTSAGKGGTPSGQSGDPGTPGQAGSEASGGGGEDSGSAGSAVGGAGNGAGGGVGVPDTVTGRLENANGSVLANQPIVVNGEVTVTDANGQFETEGVPDAYDVVVPFSAVAVILYGLTSRSPVIKLDQAGGIALMQATVGGTLSGGVGYPMPANHSAAIAVDGRRAQGDTRRMVASYGPLYASWPNTTSLDATIYAVQFRYDAGTLQPLDFTGWASKDVPLTNATPATVDLDLGAAADVSERDLTGTISVPPAFVLDAVGVDLGSITIGGDATSPPLSYSYKVPNALPVPTFLRARATHANGSVSAAELVVANAATVLDAALPAPPALVFPANNSASVDPATEFGWTPVADAVYRVTFAPVGAGPSYVVFTSENQIKIPELASVTPLPSNAAYSWTVTAYGPATTLDDLVADGELVIRSGSAFKTDSTARNFTTAN